MLRWTLALLAVSGWAVAARGQPRPEERWEVARANVMGLCEDMAHKAVPKADLDAARGEERAARRAAMDRADVAVMTAFHDQVEALDNLAREKAVVWGLGRLDELRRLIDDSPDVVDRRPGKSTPEQRDRFLDKLEHLDATLARLGLGGAPVRLSEEQGDEFLEILISTMGELEGMVKAGVPVGKRLAREQRAYLARVEATRGLLAEFQRRKVMFDRGERERAIDGIEGVLDGFGGPSPELRAALEHRRGLVRVARRFDSDVAKCGAERHEAVQRQAAPAAPKVDPEEAVRALEAEIDGWAGKVLDDPGEGVGEGYLVLRGWMVAPLAAARGADGARMETRVGGLELPGGFWEKLGPGLAPPPEPEDLTAAHFRGLGEGYELALAKRFDEALARGAERDAVRLFMAMTGLDREASRRVVGELVAVGAARRSVASGATKGGEAAGVTVPEPWPALPDAELVRRASAELRDVGRRRFPAPGPMEAPASRRDGDSEHDERLQEGMDKALSVAWTELERRSEGLRAGHEDAVRALRAENGEAAKAHLRRIRERAFGPEPSRCPDGYELCGCPELQPLESLKGWCCPAGSTCTGNPPASLGFE